MESLLYWIGLVAVSVNALTGVLDAGRKQMDLVGVVMVGSATALGGGTVRDLLLDRTVFWISDQTYLVVALATTVVIFFAVRGLRLPPRLFLIPDAVGLAQDHGTGLKLFHADCADCSGRFAREPVIYPNPAMR